MDGQTGGQVISKVRGDGVIGEQGRCLFTKLQCVEDEGGSTTDSGIILGERWLVINCKSIIKSKQINTK